MAEIMYVNLLEQLLVHARNSKCRSYYYLICIWFIFIFNSKLSKREVRITTFSLGKVIGIPDFCFIFHTYKYGNIWMSSKSSLPFLCITLAKPHHLNRPLTLIPLWIFTWESWTLNVSVPWTLNSWLILQVLLNIHGVVVCCFVSSHTKVPMKSWRAMFSVVRAVMQKCGIHPATLLSACSSRTILIAVSSLFPQRCIVLAPGRWAGDYDLGIQFINR